MIAWAGALLVGIGSLAYFGYDLAGEPAFADESAYYSQSYFAKLFAQRKRDDPAWLEYMAFDLPPLPKYMIGASLWEHGYPLPTADQARAWYQNTSLRFDPPGGLAAAKRPFAMAGALGCVALYGIGVLAFGIRAGLVAGLFLTINPLYTLHARRAMSDVPCEAFMLAALFVALWSWKRWLKGSGWPIAAIAPISVGALVGLALLAKLSGTLALIVIAAWAIVGCLAKSSGWRRLGNAVSCLAVPVATAAVFVALNPFLTAHPKHPMPPNFAEIAAKSMVERAEMMFRLRLQVAADQQRMFPHNALHLPAEKVSVMAVQGFGRFGPFGPAESDSRNRFDLNQDRGGFIWLPCVGIGLIWALLRGWSERHAGDPPTAWAIAAYWIVGFTVVTAYLPMAWDRYMLSIQAPSALLAAGLLVATVDALWGLTRPRPEGIDP